MRLDPVPDPRQHSLRRRLAAPIDVAVVGITAKAQPAVPQFPIQQGLAARDSGKPRRCGVIISRSSSFAPWSFGPSLQRHYPPSSLLWLVLTSPSLSRRSSPQVRCCFFPFIPSGSTSHVSDGHGASLCLASLPPVRGLSAGSCSYGRRFVPRCLQLGPRHPPRDPPCGSLRLPPSVAVSTLQLTSKQPMLGTLGRSFTAGYRLPRALPRALQRPSPTGLQPSSIAEPRSQGSGSLKPATVTRILWGREQRAQGWPPGQGSSTETR